MRFHFTVTTLISQLHKEKTLSALTFNLTSESICCVKIRSDCKSTAKKDHRTVIATKKPFRIFLPVSKWYGIGSFVIFLLAHFCLKTFFSSLFMELLTKVGLWCEKNKYQDTGILTFSVFLTVFFQDNVYVQYCNSF